MNELSYINARQLESRRDLSECPDTFDHGPDGTRCVEHGCITLLSMYNSGPWCHRHAQEHEQDVIREADRITAKRVNRITMPLEAARERREAILRLVDEGRPRYEIAALFDISPTTVTVILEKARQTMAQAA